MGLGGVFCKGWNTEYRSVGASLRKNTTMRTVIERVAPLSQAIMTSSSNGRTVASISYTRIVLVDVRPEKHTADNVVEDVITRRGSLGRLPRHFDLALFLPG